MDTSKEYILMCEKATEVQALCPEEMSGHHRRIGDIHILGPIYYHRHVFMDGKASAAIWLPRQDQLQEMVVDEKTTPIKLVSSIYGFVFCRPFACCRFFITMEQLWLAFVMKEKYGKVWNGEDWITPPCAGKGVKDDWKV